MMPIQAQDLGASGDDWNQHETSKDDEGDSDGGIVTTSIGFTAFKIGRKSLAEAFDTLLTEADIFMLYLRASLE